MNLVLKTDVKKTDAALNKYKEANIEVIKANAALERSEAANPNLRRDHEHPTFGGRHGDDSFEDDPITDPTGLVRGLRKIKPRPMKKAYDPFMGMTTRRDYYELQTDYPSHRLAKAKKDIKTQAGGFDFQAYFDENMLRAFAGLGCFIDAEKAGEKQSIPENAVMTG